MLQNGNFIGYFMKHVLIKRKELNRTKNCG